MGTRSTFAFWGSSIVGSVVAFGAIAVLLTGDDYNHSGPNHAPAASSMTTTVPSNLGPGGKLARAFTFATDMTQLQVDQLEKEIRGTVVQWRGPVSQVRDDPAGLVVYVGSTLNAVAFECWIANPTDAEASYAATLERGETVECRGVIDRAASFGGLVLSSSVLVR